ncbi:MAG TPA: PrsW family intramembrane metalloprotease [Mycobacteriales bacterium]|nr:PrsW family intramembrane metalloprotease [Mycobacteriales bacterium]
MTYAPQWPPTPAPAHPLPPPQGAVYQPLRKSRAGRILLLVALVTVFTLCALVLAVIIGFQFGPWIPLLGVVAAALPVPIVVLTLRWLDRYEPEPWRYLVFTFLWGALVATVSALVLQIVAGRVVAEGASAVLVAPPTEEFGKALPVLLLLLFRRREFGGVVDGIVYAGMAGIGFAFTENILYFSSAYQSGAEQGHGLLALVVLFIVRGIMSPFAHPLFAACAGIGFGLAAMYRRPLIRWGAPIAGYLLAVLLHALWNLIASAQSLAVQLLGYLFVMVPAFGAMVAIALLVRSREAKVVHRVLPAYVTAGWITPPELAWLSTMSARRGARQWARAVAGEPGVRAIHEYQFSATKLAMLRERQVRGHVDPDFGARERDLLAAVTRARQFFLQFSPYGPVPPPPPAGYLSGYR